MQKITSTAELRSAIALLETERVMQEQILKAEFHVAYERLNPANLVNSAMKNIVLSPHFVDNVLSTVIALATGYFSKQLVVGASSNILKKILGSFLQFGVSNVVVQYPDVIKSFQSIIQHLFRKKETQ